MYPQTPKSAKRLIAARENGSEGGFERASRYEDVILSEWASWGGKKVLEKYEKTPSWWLKKVRVKLAFDDVEGAWLQTSMEAVADVRIVGPHTLTSRILDYRGTDVVAFKTPAPSGMRSRDRKHKGRSD